MMIQQPPRVLPADAVDSKQEETTITLPAMNRNLRRKIFKDNRFSSRVLKLISQ